MANSFYSHLAFIGPESNAAITVLKEYLDDFYEDPEDGGKPEIVLEENQITITFDDEYNFHIYLAEEEHVNIEAVEIADFNTEDYNENPFDAEKLKASVKRFEIWGDQDFDMDYFNDSLYIMEQIEKFNDIIIFQNH